MNTFYIIKRYEQCFTIVLPAVITAGTETLVFIGFPPAYPSDPKRITQVKRRKSPKMRAPPLFEGLLGGLECTKKKQKQVKIRVFLRQCFTQIAILVKQR